MMNHCDHGYFNGRECLVIYDEEECPMCILQKRIDKLEAEASNDNQT